MDKKECFCVTYLVDESNEKNHFLYKDINSNIPDSAISFPNIPLERNAFERFLGSYAIIMYMNKDGLVDKLSEIDTKIKQVPKAEKYILVSAKIMECPKGK